ncbi:MAG: response regulator [Myxococcales bacterium]
MSMRVLVVDDSALSLEMLLGSLRGAGYDAVGATDLAALASALDTGPFQAVVLDLQMPETFGDDLLEFLREKRGIKAPLVLYSDADKQTLEQRAKTSGADAFVTKSEGVARLTEVLKGLQDKPKEKPTGKRVMIVDDSEMTAKLIEAELVGKGFEIVLADSVDKATRLILKRQTRPNLILLDVNMPNVDGSQFCRFIKGNSLFAGIKVVLCSGMELEKLKALAAECGADGVVPKDSFLSRWVLEQVESVRR